MMKSGECKHASMLALLLATMMLVSQISLLPQVNGFRSNLLISSTRLVAMESSSSIPVDSNDFVQAGIKSGRRTSTPSSQRQRQSTSSNISKMALHMAQVSQGEAQKAIDKVVAALRKDKTATSELGNLQKVNNVLGYGAPKAGSVAVRFNASFKKGGMGRSAIPMPFGLGQTNEKEGRGTMVGQVKASVDAKTGKVTECSVFRDLGYGRSFNLKC
jgi:hypothetical protein